MKVTEIEVHDITLEYCDWTSYDITTTTDWSTG